jgi:phosphatidate cytidylyltransferase
MNETPFFSSGFFPRMATAAVLLAVLVPAWFAGGAAFFLLVAVVALLAQWEFYGLFPFLAGDIPGRCLGLALGAGLLGTAWFVPDVPLSLALGLAALALAARHLVRWRKEAALPRLQREAVLLCGLIYVPLLLSPAARLSPPEQLFVLAVPVLCDSAAYFVGVRFGRHKLWPAVSPKKSVEGAVAGLLAAVAVSLAFSCLTGLVSPALIVPVGLIMGAMSQLGDLFESALKRAMNVKDSGMLLPGHGGALDRIDSLLFSCSTYAFLSFLT